MGRYVKNAQLKAGSYAMQVPLGSAALSPVSPEDGQVRFNTDNSRMEVYYNHAWNQVTREGKVTLIFDTFTGDGITTDFTMSISEQVATNVLVTIGGVFQVPDTDYTISGTQIRFNSAPPAAGEFPNPVMVIHNVNSTVTTI
jgi:hypothetical protein